MAKMLQEKLTALLQIHSWIWIPVCGRKGRKKGKTEWISGG